MRGGIKVRKSHIVTDTQGNILKVKVHAANIHDTIAGGDVFEKVLKKHPRIEGVCVDVGYRKTFKDFVEKTLKKTVKLSEKIVPGWAIISKRRVIERTFAWLNHYRRLSKDDKITITSAETNVMIAHSILLLRRLR